MKRFGKLWLQCAAMLTVLVVFSLLASDASACPTCKGALAENDLAQANIVRGYFWSIVFMMSMPFLIFGSLATYFYLLTRSAKASQAAC